MKFLVVQTDLNIVYFDHRKAGATTKEKLINGLRPFYEDKWKILAKAL